MRAQRPAVHVAVPGEGARSAPARRRPRPRRPPARRRSARRRPARSSSASSATRYAVPAASAWMPTRSSSASAAATSPGCGRPRRRRPPARTARRRAGRRSGWAAAGGRRARAWPSPTRAAPATTPTRTVRSGAGGPRRAGGCRGGAGSPVRTDGAGTWFAPWGRGWRGGEAGRVALSPPVTKATRGTADTPIVRKCRSLQRHVDIRRT